MFSKALRFSKNNKTVKLATIPSATNKRTANQRDQDLTGEQELKVLAIGRSKFNLSRRIVRWLQPCMVTNDTAQQKQQASTNAISSGNSATDGATEDILRKPLLDGGQGETNVSNNVFLQPQGDVNAEVGTTTTLPNPPTNGEDGQFPERVNSYNAHSHDVNAERGQPTSTHSQPGNGNARQGHLDGLSPPILNATGNLVAGRDIKKLQLQNKRRWHALRERQTSSSAWTIHQGDTSLPPSTPLPEQWRGEMCPSGIATSHPAGGLLTEWATFGCPTRTGRPWTKEKIWEAIERGPHQSALSKDALEHFATESIEKVESGQAKIVEWDSIKHNPPSQLKISPIAAILHKSRGFRSILDLSFSLRLKYGGISHSVNYTTVKMAPKGALDQLGRALSSIIHAFADSDEYIGSKIFMAKWDIKDGFWRMCCKNGEEWNFAYVLP
jgi:hypothetical protein